MPSGTRAANIRRVKSFFVNITMKCSFVIGPVLSTPGPGVSCSNEAMQHLAYFFASGGKGLNIFSTPLLRFLMFLSELLDSVSLDELRQTSSFDSVSNRATTRLPTV